MGNSDARRLPVVSLSAEHLAIGYLMRRNILAYKAPPNNEGYDLICIHPNPRNKSKPIHVQVKSRYQTDCDGTFPLDEKSVEAFDYLIVVFQNIGFYYRKKPVLDGYGQPEFYTLPKDWVAIHFSSAKPGWQKVHIKKDELGSYKNEKGFDLIAAELGIPYPGLEVKP